MSEQTGTQMISVRVPKALAAELQKQARKQQQTVTQIILRGIQTEVQTNQTVLEPDNRS